MQIEYLNFFKILLQQKGSGVQVTDYNFTYSSVYYP